MITLHSVLKVGRSAGSAFQHGRIILENLKKQQFSDKKE